MRGLLFGMGVLVLGASSAAGEVLTPHEIRPDAYFACADAEDVVRGLTPGPTLTWLGTRYDLDRCRAAQVAWDGGTHARPAPPSGCQMVAEILDGDVVRVDARRPLVESYRRTCLGAATPREAGPGEVTPR